MEREETILKNVDYWHHEYQGDKELHEYLGWTWEEYKSYVESGEFPEKREGAA